MHVVMLLAGAGVLLAVMGLIARWRGGWAGVAAAMPLYVGVWLCAALANFYAGVVHAGYSVAAEAVVFIVVFGVPAAAAWLLRRTALAKGR